MAWPRPMAPCLPSQAPVTTVTAGTQIRTRAVPGATSAASPALPRSGLARTCAAQVPAWDPRGLRNTRSPAPRAAWEPPLQPLRTCGRTAPAGRAPPPPRPIGQGCLQAAGPKAHWPPPPLYVSSLRERLVNNRGRRAPPRGGVLPPHSAAWGSPRAPRPGSELLSHHLSVYCLWSICCVLGFAHSPFLSTRGRSSLGDLSLREVQQFIEGNEMAGSKFESKSIRFERRLVASVAARQFCRIKWNV